jgi:AraC family transcriptional regulator of adaptative response/methylated-DNA-[protein]-cysteine methyltransferase
MRKKRIVGRRIWHEHVATPDNVEPTMNQEQCWKAVTERDRSSDGRFFYGVMTTGVYCRPSCASRLPLRQNVRFFATPAEAEADGLRPCKRCRPLESSSDPMARKIAALCRHIEAHAEDELSLKELSEQAHTSPFHLQRSFKAVVGVTPKQYVEACRLRALKKGLRNSGSVTRAIFDAGFSSTSRVYERVASRLGMTPAQYRAGGAGIEISYAISKTALGPLMMAATDRGLCFVQFGASEYELQQRVRMEFPGAAITPMKEGSRELFAQWMETLSNHLAGTRPQLELPVDLRGTAFQLKVWNYLQKIPYGEVRSYSEVARGIGQPSAVRAVARACATNNVALVVPCHRVIRGDGGLGGYRWGLDRKRTLIDRERAVKAGTVAG